MPHGGRRPGAGAPRGNTNALGHGSGSLAAHIVREALKAHPNVRELYRIMVVHGLWPRRYAGGIPGSRAAKARWVSSVVRLLHPALLDCSHPYFNQLNQVNQLPESDRTTPWPGPSFSDDEITEIREQSRRHREGHPYPALKQQDPTQ